MPTSRNTKGVDIIIYNQDVGKRHTIQSKSLAKKAPVPFGSSIASLDMNDYLIICRNVYTDAPEIFITTPSEIKDRIHKGINEKGQVSYWLEPKEYEQFINAWDKIENV